MDIFSISLKVSRLNLATRVLKFCLCPFLWPICNCNLGLFMLVVALVTLTSFLITALQRTSVNVEKLFFSFVSCIPAKCLSLLRHWLFARRVRRLNSGVALFWWTPPLPGNIRLGQKRPSGRDAPSYFGGAPVTTKKKFYNIDTKHQYHKRKDLLPE